MDYAALVAALYEQNQFAIKYDLDGMREALRVARIGRPAPTVVLVGGTNGKGSTSAALNALAMAAGLRVGLYTSPHLVDFRERIRIDGVPLSRDRVAEFGSAIFARFSGRRRAAETTRPLSYFELATLIAWRAFVDAELDLAIFEVGLGGRLDATNVLDPDLSILTSLSLDHQAYLGDTLDLIAAEKAAISRPGRPALLHRDSGGYTELREALHPYGANVHTVDAGEDAAQWNRALAERAFGMLFPALDNQALRHTAARNVRWPGRRHSVRSGERGLFVDGAHNPAAAVQCRQWIRDELAARIEAPSTIPVIIGVSGGRDAAELARCLSTIASRFVATKAQSAPCTEPGEVARAIREAGLECCTAPSVADALARTSGAPMTLVTGSLYLVGDTLAHLGFDADDLRVYEPEAS